MITDEGMNFASIDSGLLFKSYEKPYNIYYLVSTIKNISSNYEMPIAIDPITVFVYNLIFF